MSGKRVSSVRLIWLEAFVEVASCRSYKEAGEKLDVDPTVIKKYVVRLEMWLEKKLHFRFEDRIVITEEGEEFLAKAKTITELMHDSREFIINADNIGENFKRVNKFLVKYMRDGEG